MSSFQDNDSATDGEYPSISEQPSLLPENHNLRYPDGFITGSDDDKLKLRLVYTYIMFPIIIYLYLVFSYLSITRPFSSHSNNQFALKAVGDLCLMSGFIVFAVRGKFDDYNVFNSFPFAEIFVFIHLTCNLSVAIILVCTHTFEFIYLYECSLWLLRVPSCYIFYYFTYGCVSAFTRFLSVQWPSVRETIFEYLLCSKPRITLVS